MMYSQLKNSDLCSFKDNYTRDLQKVSGFFVLQLYFIVIIKTKYIISLPNHPVFQHIFPSVLPTS